MVTAQNHEILMRRCFTLASLGLGQTAPNPLVGCVIVKDGEIIGEGFHRKFGERHAEVDAMSNVKEQSMLVGSTIYVNLEPCNHHGKTPPCTEAVVKAGVSKVIISNVDPNPLVAGSGIRYLKERGVEVVTGVCDQEGAYLNRRFLVYHKQKRPYVILKWAQTSDGFIAPLDSLRKNSLEPFWISCETSRLLVHKWRSEEQSILVGRKTIEMDNPALTCRYPGGINPIRIAIDPELKIAKSKRIFDRPGRVIVLNRLKSEISENIQYLKLQLTNAYSVLDTLYQQGIQSVLVEGGTHTIMQFIQDNLWDECRIFTSPTKLEKGIKSPSIKREPDDTIEVSNDRLDLYLNKMLN